jgi:hypothetical protein
MERTENGWTVIDRTAGVLSYSYAFKAGRANAFAARIAGGRMLVVSPPCDVADGVFTDLLAFGDVGALVAPNGFHYLGIPEWRERFPNARAFAAPESVARIAKKSPAAGSFEPMGALQSLLGPEVGVREAPATKVGETWAWAKTATGHAWFGSDILINMQKLPPNPLFALAFRLSGSGPGFKLFKLALMLTLKDKKRALGAMLADVRAHPPHGAVLARDGLADETAALLSAAL